MASNSFTAQPNDIGCPGYVIPNEHAEQLNDDTSIPSFSNYSSGDDTYNPTISDYSSDDDIDNPSSNNHNGADESLFHDDSAEFLECLDVTEANEAANYNEYDHLLAQFERSHTDDVLDNQDEQAASDVDEQIDNDVDYQRKIYQVKKKDRCGTACKEACTCLLSLAILVCLVIAIAAAAAALGVTNQPVPTSTCTLPRYTDSQKPCPDGLNVYKNCKMTCSASTYGRTTYEVCTMTCSRIIDRNMTTAYRK